MTIESEPAKDPKPPAEGDPKPPPFEGDPRPPPEGDPKPAAPPQRDPAPGEPAREDPPPAQLPAQEPPPSPGEGAPSPMQAAPAQPALAQAAPEQAAPEQAAPEQTAAVQPAPAQSELLPGELLKSDEEELAEAVKSEQQLLAEAARFATPERIRNVVEALLFAAEKPLDLQMLIETTRFSKEQLEQALLSVQVRYPGQGASGIALLDVGGKLSLRTDPEVGGYVRRMLQVKPMRLTRAAMETLAIIAYRQPITRPEMEDLRGVDCGAVTKALLERKLVRILGKKDEPGRPLLYGTSKEFLELFNLRDLTQLPTLREFQELSEESRKIVEEEAPAAAVAPLQTLQVDPATAERLAKAAAESDHALDALEKAMASADATTKLAASVLAPPAPPAVETQNPTEPVGESRKPKVESPNA